MNKLTIGLIIGFFATSSFSQDHAIVDVNVVTMQDETILENRTVLISEGKIKEIVSVENAVVPSEYEIIDGHGKYLIPGLFDMHMHFLSDDRVPADVINSELFIPLAYGVTNARIMIGRPEHLLLRREISEGFRSGPSLYVASPQLTAVSYFENANARIVNDYDQGFQAVIDFHKQGYEFIKLTFGMDESAFKGVIDAATQVEIPVVGHVSRKIKIRKALEEGQQIEHLDQYLDGILRDDAPTDEGLSAFGIFQKDVWKSVDYVDSSKLEEIIDLTVTNNVWNTPTNYFFNSSFASGSTDEELMQSPEWSWVSSEVRDELLRYRGKYWENPAPLDQREKYVKIRAYIIRELFRRSGKIMAGSDAPEWLNMYGTGLHRELKNFVEVVGLTPFEALQTATTKPAEFLVLGTKGYVLTGYDADLVMLSSNPLENIENLKSIEGVFHLGKWYPKDDIQVILKKSIKSLQKARLRE